MVGSLQYGNIIPEVVIVGIAYQEDVTSYMRKRERDYLPAEVENHPGSGQAGSFLNFIQDELLPMVESEYRIDSRDRTLAGMSGGATFASYVLFTAPELFKRYIIVSPYFIYGQEVVQELEREYAGEHRSLPVRLYTAMGQLEPDYARDPWSSLVDSLQSRGYPGLKLKREVLDGHSHLDVVFAAYVRGLKAVFSDGSEILRAVPDNCRACAGEYIVKAGGKRFTVRADKDSLFITSSGEYWDRLIPVSNSAFGIEGNPNIGFSFVTGEDGSVIRLIIHHGGMQIPAEKTD
jgi:hypothetical protein